eukprot:NODE_87_length_2595_cov_39.214847_g81_i0.p1 GENE.NODE_87_length_2595_cov_39.214847_g81_i0~~NODE_87_length_2595_cov_39.214847_g81_i0.p1  ORF type:complete len:719 (+),score=192.33 NODE_87_length_2595_cov_39.214847_g81_i0:349-2505(+)
MIWKLDHSVQAAGAKGLQAASPHCRPAHFDCIFDILKTMIGIHNDEIRGMWNDTLLEATRHLPADFLESKVLGFALQIGELTEAQESRRLCCALIGSLAGRLSGPVFEESLLSKALSFCQDTDYTVRAAMCRQLHPVSRAIGLSRTKELIIKELVELLADEEPEVSRSALSTLTDMMEFLDSEFRKQSILPLVRNYVANTPPELHQLLLQVFGKVLWQLSGEIQSDEDILLFCNFFKTAAQRTDQDLQAATCRGLCAYNFPAVVKSIGAKKYSVYLSSTYKALCEDSTVLVRRRMAAGFHEVCVALGDKALTLKDSLLSLVQDSDIAVREAIFEHISDILFHFKKISNEDKQVLTGCVNPICVYESSIKSSWRRTSMLLDHFEHFPEFCSPDTLHDKFIPILFRHLAQGATIVKDKCAWLLILFTRKLHNNQQQVDIFNRLLSEFGRSKSFWHRQTFVSICHCCLARFSRKFFREKMLEAALDLSKDPVSGVRWRLCYLLPDIKRVVDPPSPIELLASFNERVTRLSMDSDADVAEAARQAQQDMREMEAESQRRFELKIVDTDERLDLVKEEEENTLFEVAQEQERQQRRRVLRDLIAEGEKIMPTGMPGNQSNRKPVKNENPNTKDHHSPGRKRPATPPGFRKTIPSPGRTPKSGQEIKIPAKPGDQFSKLPSAGEARKSSFGNERPRKSSLGSPSSLPSGLPTLPSTRTVITKKK